MLIHITRFSPAVSTVPIFSLTITPFTELISALPLVSMIHSEIQKSSAIRTAHCLLVASTTSQLNTHFTREVMSRYGKVKNLRLVHHIVTGASCGYAFVEFESEREMYRAYQDAHHTVIDDSEIIVDYNRQQLMPGWIPRRLGGGLGGKKESGQLRFGGRERPFRAPLRPIPYDDLKRLGIPPPPEGQYMTRFEVPSPPRRPRSSVDRDEHSRSHSHSHKCQKHSKHSHRHDRRRSSSKDHFFRLIK